MGSTAFKINAQVPTGAGQNSPLANGVLKEHLLISFRAAHTFAACCLQSVAASVQGSVSSDAGLEDFFYYGDLQFKRWAYCATCQSLGGRRSTYNVTRNSISEPCGVCWNCKGLLCLLGMNYCQLQLSSFYLQGLPTLPEVPENKMQASSGRVCYFCFVLFIESDF